MKISSTMRRNIRRGQTEANARYGTGGLEKQKTPKPITLRRAQYEANKAAERSLKEADNG